MRKSRDNNSSFAMPCKNLAYPIRTITHAITPTVAEDKQGSATTTAVNLQWPSDGTASMQGRAKTKSGSGLNTRWTVVFADDKTVKVNNTVTDTPTKDMDVSKIG